MSTKNMLNWYESNLPARERKIRGHFSTPPRLVEDILDACNYTAQHDLSRLRVLDPACGSGNFLIGAAHRLINFGIHFSKGRILPSTLLQRNIWGLDPDPIACFLAEMQIQAILSEYNEKMAHVRKHKVSPRSLHIHQADGLAIAWDKCENVDLFLANPPYLAAKNNDLSGYSAHQQSGQSDSYLLFLRLALQIVRPNGWIALVLPDPVLARANATHERQRLLSETTVHHLWHLAGVFNAHVGAAVIIAQKRLPHKLHQISWRRERWQHKSINMDVRHMPSLDYTRAVSTQHEQQNTVAQALLQQQPGAELRYLLSTVQDTLVARLHAHLLLVQGSKSATNLSFLGRHVLIRRGEELGKNSPYLKHLSTDDSREFWYPVLRGGTDIRPLAVPIAHRWIEREHIQKEFARYLNPKLLVVKSTGRLQATLDLRGHVALQTLYMLQLHDTISRQNVDELYFLLALLNTRLLQEYVYILYTAYKWIQPQIEQHVLTHLPIPIFVDPLEKSKIVQRAKLLTDACSEISPVVELKEQLYAEQERAICALYEAALCMPSDQMSKADNTPSASLTISL